MFRIITVAAFFVALAAPVNAQTFPNRPVRILVPYEPGGITDIAARLVGAKLGEYWGHQVVVENKPGGNGLIAMMAAVRADPDGYTLVMASGGDVSLNPALLKKMPYDVERDLVPITGVSDAPIVLKGGGPALQALISGVVPLGILASSSIASNVKGGTLRVLGVTSAKRSTLNPEWPTLQEQGVTDVNASNWTALFAPKGTPQAIVDKLNADVVRALDSSDVKERFASGGAQVIPSTPSELATRLKSELTIYRSVIAKSGMHLE